MSCKHSTPSPQSQRACPEPVSKAKIPTSPLPSLFWASVKRNQSFVKEKLKIPPAHPSVPSLQPNPFYCFSKKNKNPQGTHKPPHKRLTWMPEEIFSWGCGEGKSRRGADSRGKDRDARISPDLYICELDDAPPKNGGSQNPHSTKWVGVGGCFKTHHKALSAHSMSSGQLVEKKKNQKRMIFLPAGGWAWDGGLWRPLLTRSPPSPHHPTRRFGLDFFFFFFPPRLHLRWEVSKG